MHIVEKVKKTADYCDQRRPADKLRHLINQKVDRCINGAQNLIIVIKEGVLTTLTALRTTKSISLINQRTTADYCDQRRPADKSHVSQLLLMQTVVNLKHKNLYLLSRESFGQPSRLSFLPNAYR